MFVQNLEFVLVVANHFYPERKTVKGADGKMIIRLDEDFFDTIFKFLNINRYANIDMQTTHAYYEKHSDKCLINMIDNWLKTPRPTITRWLKTFHHNDFIEDVNDLVTLLSRVSGLHVSHT